MTLTGYDQSPECHAFIESVKAQQGFISNARYDRRHNATIELTAYVPDQPDLIPNEIQKTS